MHPAKTQPQHMKWWGWGNEQIQFDISDKPALWPYIKDVLGFEKEVCTPPVAFDQVEMPQQRNNAGFLHTARAFLNDDQVRVDKRERLLHAYGKSFRDLWRIRHGIVEAAPDCIIYVESEDDVVKVVRAAAEHDVILIPFGGGSNIAGCLEAKSSLGRMVVSLDLRRMRRVLAVDKQSRTARIQAGVFGPDLERQLGRSGVTLGHFPDSFEYSTLGGWIATRSAGMQSDKYGKIEDMVISLRMVTPSGTIVTRTVPKSSNGIDVNQICIGSEGILGVMTEATMQVHEIPERRQAYGYLFPDFESGVQSMYECVARECMPDLVRLNDPAKTALSFAFKSASGPVKTALGHGVKAYLKHVKKFDFDKVCLLLTAFEGSARRFNETRQRVDSIYQRFGAFSLGTEPGDAFERTKYDFPYLRDYVMDRNIMADVSETATVWSNLLPLYYGTMSSIEEAVLKTGSKPFLGCHISHTYHTGTSLYFTFGCLQRQGRELEQYLYIKKAAEDAFMRHGATLSHHHAVGTEHQPWVEEDVSATGIRAVRALKEGLDPNGIMNPGKIIPSRSPLAVWGMREDTLKEFEQNGGATSKGLILQERKEVQTSQSSTPET